MRSFAAFFALLLSASAWAEMPGEPPEVDLANAEKMVAQQCVACHGADGNSATPLYPKLAAQHADYIYKQLKDFAVQPGAEVAKRENAIMAGFAAGLSDQDKRDLAAYFEQQTPEMNKSTNKDLVELGQKIYRAGIASKNVPACAACHGPTGAGIPSQYPRLKAQHPEYTAGQLKAFRGEIRKNNRQMTDISSRLSDKEIQAVSDYIAGLR